LKEFSEEQDSKLIRLIVFAVLIFFSLSVLNGESFLSGPTFLSMAYQLPEMVLYSLSLSLAMLLGGIDLSMVGLGNVAGIVAVMIMHSPMGESSPFLATIIAILTALAVGALGGLLNGILIAKVGIPAMLATLGTGQLFQGICFILTKGTAVFGVTKEFAFLGSGKVLGIPFALIITLIIIIYLVFIFQHQILGKQIYLVGTNAYAAEFSGINKDSVIIKTHVLGGIFAALAGLIVCSRAESIKADYGNNYVLQTILIAVLGGIDPMGGFGRFSGVFLAAITLQILQTGLNLLRVNPQQKELVWGGLLIIFMIVNYHANKSAIRKKIKRLHDIQAISSLTKEPMKGG
jgi:simple sugar transport system permease protein